VAARESRSVEVAIIFECPNKHEIKRKFTHVAAPGGHRIVENQVFDLTCLICGWSGSLRGNQRLAIKIRKERTL
jgi:hypothetical protein